MAKTLNLPFDLVATIPRASVDQFGVVLPAPSDQSVASSAPAVAAQLTATGVALAATARTGSATITLSNTGGLTPDTVVVTITAPSAVANFLDVGNVTFAANPNPPTA